MNEENPSSQLASHPSSMMIDTTVKNIPENTHLHFPTWGIVIFLIIVFFVLKTFLYLKDEKRHGK